MKPCCQQEAERSIRRNRDVAICDGCGWLILGYDDPDDYQNTLDELCDTPHAVGTVGDLRVIAKQRTSG